MSVHFVGILLLALHPAQSHRYPEKPQELALTVASPGDTADIHCTLPSNTYSWKVKWYKEEEGKNLREIYQSSRYTKQEGKYPSQGHNLIISDVKRNDSGVYYCAAFTTQGVRLMSRSRLIISGASRPRLSIFAPSSLEDAELIHPVPLLCLLLDANPDQDTLSWDIGGESSQGEKDGDTVDGEGAFTVWSLRLIPPERWSQEMAYSCSHPAGGNISSVVPENAVSAGNCWYILPVGLSCVVTLLLIPLSVLLYRKRFAGGNREEPANQIPMRETQEEGICYAELDFASGKGDGMKRKAERRRNHFEI